MKLAPEPEDETFDAVVIGSGFGGAVMTYMLARRGMRVCLLERGKAYPPGSFPRSPSQMRASLWDPSEGLHGLFNVWSFKGLDAVVASGLGGGSLIYANVLLRKPRDWFGPDWPVSYDDLEPHYAAVEQMLGATPYPHEHSPYRDAPKAAAFRAAAEQLGHTVSHPPLAITFALDGKPPEPGVAIPGGEENLHGRARTTCRLCGECDLGCNYGSKNSLDYTYLSQACRFTAPDGTPYAEIRTGCEVRSFQPVRRSGGGLAYRVAYVEHQAQREGQGKQQLRTIRAAQLILAAGALGSTYLLLRNRAAFPRLSKRLGTGFSGNGNFLAFARKARGDAPGQTPGADSSYGPVITSSLHMTGASAGASGRGYFIQDAGYPQFASWLFALSPKGLLRALGSRRWLGALARLLWRALRRPNDASTSAELAGLLGLFDLSGEVLPLLGIGQDVADGRLRLRGRFIDLDGNWRKREESARYYRDVRGTMERLAAAMGAELSDNLLWQLGRGIIAHPLGGCPMGASPEAGVVDANGQVFNYPGLFVADGAVMPGPVGANPALTIAALASKFAQTVIENYEQGMRNKP